MSTYADLNFGTIAVDLGLAADAAVRAALRKQLDEVEQGLPRRSLGDLMAELGSLSQQQVLQVLAEQQLRIAAQSIGPYQLLGMLGQGSMGDVYKARVPATGAEVAIKLLPEKLESDLTAIERFKREATVGMAIDHPHIVRTLDFGEDHGRCYLVFELVPGGDLEQVLEKRRTLPEAEALAIVNDIAQALQHAHEQGLVHRDIKPSNLLFAADGRVKLADFGLVKDLSARHAHAGELGLSIGTPYYIAPEQALGTVEVDVRADIYALGATLYHLVTGHVPFTGSPNEVLGKHVKERLIPPRTRNPAVSVGCSAYIEKMMAKDREQRFQLPSAVALEASRLMYIAAEAAMAAQAGPETTSARRATDSSRSHPAHSPHSGHRPGVRKHGSDARHEMPRPAALWLRLRAALRRPMNQLLLGIAVVVVVLCTLLLLPGPPPIPPPPVPPPVAVSAPTPAAPPGRPASGADIAPAVPVPTPAANAAVDLLALIQPTRDQVGGLWSRHNNGVYSNNVFQAYLELPYLPPAEYDLRVDFTCIDSNGTVQIVVALPRVQGIWKIGGAGNTTYGFAMVGGLPSTGNPTTVRRPRCLDSGRRYQALISVRTDRIKASIDGEALCEWQPSLGNLTLPPDVPMRRATSVGVGSSGCTTAFHRIDLVAISGKGAVIAEKK